MKLRFHSDLSLFYDQRGNLYPELKETLEELEAKLKVACTTLPWTRLDAPLSVLHIANVAFILKIIKSLEIIR